MELLLGPLELCRLYSSHQHLSAFGLVYLLPEFSSRDEDHPRSLARSSLLRNVDQDRVLLAHFQKNWLLHQHDNANYL